MITSNNFLPISVSCRISGTIVPSIQMRQAIRIRRVAWGGPSQRGLKPPTSMFVFVHWLSPARYVSGCRNTVRSCRLEIQDRGSHSGWVPSPKWRQFDWLCLTLIRGWGAWLSPSQATTADPPISNFGQNHVYMTSISLVDEMVLILGGLRILAVQTQRVCTSSSGRSLSVG